MSLFPGFGGGRSICKAREKRRGDEVVLAIFIDMFAPKWARGHHNLARFPSWDPCTTPGYWPWYLNVLPTSGSLVRSLFYAFMPRDGIYTCVFYPPPPPPPLSEENPVMLHFFAYAEIIFAHILAFPACTIEVQHIMTILLLCRPWADNYRSGEGRWVLDQYLGIGEPLRVWNPYPC